MEDLNVSELKIMNAIKKSLETPIDDKIKYSISKEIVTIRNWVNRMVISVIVGVITCAFFVGGLVVKVNGFIEAQEKANDEFRKAMSVIPEFDKKIVLSDKNIQIVASEIEKINPKFKANIVARGSVIEESKN